VFDIPALFLHAYMRKAEAKENSMSVTKTSKTEHLLNLCLELRALCYSQERMSEEKIQLQGNHLLQCDHLMQKMLTDLNVPKEEGDCDEDQPVMQRIEKNLSAFERALLGTESVIARSINVENLIVKVERVKDRMSYGSWCSVS
jgi:hypothetical protein